MHNLTEIEAGDLLGISPLDFPTWAQGVLITDGSLPDNPIIYANSGFQKLTGYTPEEIIGKNCRILQGPMTRKYTVSAIEQAICCKRRYNAEILNYRKDGTEFWSCLSLGPLRCTSGHDLFVWLLSDITDQPRQNSLALTH